MLKIMFKKYSFNSGYGRGSRINSSVTLPAVLSENDLGKFFYKSGKASFDKDDDSLLSKIAE